MLTHYTHKRRRVHNVDLFRQKLPTEVDGNSHSAWSRWNLSRTRTSLMSHLCSGLHPNPSLSPCLRFSGWTSQMGQGVSVSIHRSKDNLFAKFQATAQLLPALRIPLSSFPYLFSEKKNDIWADILNTVSLPLTGRNPGIESILDLNW